MNIDFHAHILPGADHGSRSLEVSLQQLDMARQAGMDTVVATPHFYPLEEDIEDFLERRRTCSLELREAVRGGNYPEILVASEAQLCRGMENIPGLSRLCIEGTNTLLLELPPDYSIRYYEQTLDALLFGHDLRIVLAHVDRYAPTQINFLLDAGARAQVNAESVCRLRTRRLCMDWIQSGAAVALGSDIHGLSVGYSEFLRAKKHLGGEYESLMKRTVEFLPAV